MGSVITLSIVGMVQAFLIAVLADFPIEEALTLYDTNDESYNVEAVQEVGNLFTGNVTSLIDEMVSYQTDPNYARAEARREDMVEGVARKADPAPEIGGPERELSMCNDREARHLEQSLLIVPIPESPVAEVRDDPAQKNRVEQQEEGREFEGPLSFHPQGPSFAAESDARGLAGK